MTADQPPTFRQDAKGPIAFVIGGFVGAFIFAMGTMTLKDRDTMDSDLAFYREVREIVGAEFVQERTDEQLLISAVKGIAGDLDIYSSYYSGDDLARVERSTSGTFLGLGAIFAEPIGEGLLLFPMVDSPAQRAGLSVGDRILAIDEESLDGMAPGEFRAILRSLTAEPLELLVESSTGETRNLTVQPESIVDPTVRHGELLGDSVGYLAITSFSRRTLEEFDTEIEQLQAEGMTGLVLDLRNNPGGVLRIALSIANRFVDEGPLLYTDSRMGREEKRADPDEASLLGLPLVILIDRDSASSSEVLAGSLQDHRAAVVVGMPSYGKGTVQTLTTLERPHSILKVTTAFYTTPSGRQIDRHYSGDEEAAITPDLLVAQATEREDLVRTRLRSYSAPRAYRTAVGDLRDSLGLPSAPLWSADEQLVAAVDLLLGKQPLYMESL
ncbi:MAG: carboxyl-terminal processing protease [Bacteroidia bacterium]|jgi:carboxyl-terminal processing protease